MDRTVDFEELLNRYESKIFNLILRLVGDYEEAADLTQETFIQAFKALPEFRGESQIYTWLYSIAVNRTKNRLKQLERQQRLVPESLDEPIAREDGDLEREVPDWTYSPEQVLERKELQQVVQREIQNLPEDFREVIVLRDLQGLSYRDIAHILGISVEALKSRLFRARSCLRERLRPYLEGG